MKNTLIKIQNFFVTLAMFIRHPVAVPDMVLAYRNHKELTQDIEEINRESIKSLYVDLGEIKDTEEKKKPTRC